MTEKETFEIFVKGTKWFARLESEEENPNLEDSLGVIYENRKIISLNKDVLLSSEGDFSDDNPLFEMLTTVRHELIHAHLFECGLGHSTCKCSAWADNEEMVDFFATQIPFIEKCYKKVADWLTEYFAESTCSRKIKQMKEDAFSRC